VETSENPNSEPTLAAVLSDYGGAIEVFRPSIANLVAGMILGTLMALGGLALVAGVWYLVFRLNGEFSSTTVVGTVAGLLLGIVGVGLLYLLPGMFSYRLFVCPHGLVRSVGGKVDACQWDEIVSVTEKVQQEHLPLEGVAKRAVPLGKSRNYTILRRDGIEFYFDADAVQKVGRLAQLIRGETDRRGIAWQIES
jgi:hypothetical protein